MSKKFVEMLFKEQEYKDIVRTTILYMLPNIKTFDFDDCFSEVYLIALKAKKLDEHPNIKGWLNLTTKNVVKRFKSKRALDSIVISDLDVGKGEMASDDFICDVENKSEYNEVLNKLSGSLSKSDYRLFKLRYIDGLSSKEIGEILGIKVESVDMKFTRLRKKMKKIL